MKKPDNLKAVVLCKECMYWNLELKECDRESRVFSFPAAYAMNFEADDWCSYGERKENE
jgi:hypothetical protein